MIPPIKWTGSKRSQAKEILSYFPEEIETYYEPFCGGASILLELLQQSGIKIKYFKCSDLNNDLILLWNEIKNNPVKLHEEYAQRWKALKIAIDRNKYYLEQREEFNKSKNIYSFYFINRTSFNGMVRYNKKGGFNSPFHFGRDGIEPTKLLPVLLKTSELLNINNVEFVSQSYNEIKPNNNDFCFFDPPYFNTKGLYFDGFNSNDFISFLSRLNCGYALTYDGKRGDINMTADIPKELYDKHILMGETVSGFGKIVNSADKVKVRESLYIKL